jgi:hypothetical protein
MKRQMQPRLAVTADTKAPTTARRMTSSTNLSSAAADVTDKTTHLPIKKKSSPNVPQYSPTKPGDSQLFRKHNSVDTPSNGMGRRLSKSATFDAGSAMWQGNVMKKPSASLNMATRVKSPATYEQKAKYHTVSQELLSVSPLQPSPSMLLLNRTAEVLSGEEGAERIRRMPVQTTTKVFEVRRSVPGPATSLSRQESLLAVFKPATDDEDSLLLKSETSFKFSAEERALRERAAYVLDKAHSGFSRVPATALARLQNNNGSLQEYVRSNGTAEDNPTLVGKASPEEVQRIAVLDCRILNLDRHGGNVLVSVENEFSEKPTTGEDESVFTVGEEAFDEPENSRVTLTPIDHSLSLPPWTKLGDAWFDWSYWPQANEPLSKTARDHIKALNRNDDEARLLELGIKPDCVATNSICTLALQALVRSTPEITLKAMGEFFQRPYSVGHKLHEVESPLEHLVNEACIKAGIEKSADNTGPGPTFFFAFEKVLDEQIKTGNWRSFVV